MHWEYLRQLRDIYIKIAMGTWYLTSNNKPHLGMTILNQQIWVGILESHIQAQRQEGKLDLSACRYLEKYFIRVSASYLYCVGEKY